MTAKAKGAIRGKVNLRETFHRFDEPWTPKIVGELNGQYVKLAKCRGELVWHAHEEEDELFLVVRGQLTLHLRDRSVELSEGELFIVPRGVEHLPVAEEEAWVLLFEPKSTAHTGSVVSELTQTELEWL